MPLYEYQCTACRVKFDLLRRFSEADAPAACPKCGGHETKRAMSRFATLSGGDGGDYADSGGGDELGDGGGGGGCAGCSSGDCSHCKH